MFIDPTRYPPIRSGLLVVDILAWDMHSVRFQEASISRLLELPLIRGQIRPDHGAQDKDHCEEEEEEGGGG